jgi:hypothetical protein
LEVIEQHPVQPDVRFSMASRLSSDDNRPARYRRTNHCGAAPNNHHAVSAGNAGGIIDAALAHRCVLDQLFGKVLDLVFDQHGSLLQQHASLPTGKIWSAAVLPWVSAALEHFRDAEGCAAFERFRQSMGTISALRVTLGRVSCATALAVSSFRALTRSVS